jgi:uncharacterized protein YjbI with pentapeptide repeats
MAGNGPVRLCVGGRSFATSKSTLTQMTNDGNSFFALLLSRDSEHGDGSLPAARIDGQIFLDRDPDCFAALLRWMRGGELRRPAGISRMQWDQEIDFYGLSGSVGGSGDAAAAAAAEVPGLASERVLQPVSQLELNQLTTAVERQASVVVRLCGLDMSGLLFRGAYGHVVADECDLSGADLCGATFESLSCRKSNLSAANFSGASITTGNFSGSNLESANFSRASLSKNVEFSAASLKSADFSSATLWYAKFVDADLTSASFLGARNTGFRQGDFKGAVVEGCVFDQQFFAGISHEQMVGTPDIRQ